ncbi:hypothetical protein AKJ16_DCAP10193 [Drosera capensis]
MYVIDGSSLPCDLLFMNDKFVISPEVSEHDCGFISGRTRMLLWKPCFCDDNIVVFPNDLSKRGTKLVMTLGRVLVLRAW